MPTTENQRHGAAEKTAVTNTHTDAQKVVDTRSKAAQRRVNPTHTERWGVTAVQRRLCDASTFSKFSLLPLHCAEKKKQIQLKC